MVQNLIDMIPKDKLLRVYVKTGDVTGDEDFFAEHDIFFVGILTYFKEAYRNTAENDPLPGALVVFRCPLNE